MDAVIVHEDGVATVGKGPHTFLQKHFHTLNSLLSAPRGGDWEAREAVKTALINEAAHDPSLEGHRPAIYAAISDAFHKLVDWGYLPFPAYTESLPQIQQGRVEDAKRE